MRREATLQTECVDGASSWDTVRHGAGAALRPASGDGWDVVGYEHGVTAALQLRQLKVHDTVRMGGCCEGLLLGRIIGSAL
jgi:hypothetical protein